MHLRHTFIILLAVFLTGTSGVVFAQEKSPTGNTLLPVIPMGQGDACVEDTDFMRRNHMELLKHQRDETVLEGVRSVQYSLKECLSCHVVYGPDSVPVTAASPNHFCRSCHDYAAVSIDCFQCHASRPQSGEIPADHPFRIALPGTTSGKGFE